MNEENEIWKYIPGYEGYYEASNLGRIRSKSRIVYNNLTKGNSIRKEKILNGHKNIQGYNIVRLSVKGIKSSGLVHRLVLKAFVGESQLGVDHINGIKTDNRLSNLEYVSIRENNIRYRQITSTLPVGVYLKKANGKYGAKIAINKIQYSLGVYNTIHEARQAYLNASNDINNINNYHKKKLERNLPIGVRKYGEKYRAQIKINGIGKHLGTFENIEYALEAYNKAKKEREILYAMS